MDFHFQPQIPLEVHQSHSGNESGENSTVYDIAANESVTCSPGESEVDAHSSNLSISDEYRSGSPAVTRGCAILPPYQENFTGTRSGAVQPLTASLLPSANASAIAAPPIVPRRNKTGAPVVPRLCHLSLIKLLQFVR